MSIIRDTIDSMRNGTLFDFISNNAHLLSKDVLANIIKEIDFAVYDEHTPDEYKSIMDSAAYELEELYKE